MSSDRTEAHRPAARPVGLLPSRRHLVRPAGAGGPGSVLLGGLLVVAAVLVFVAGLGDGRATLGFTVGEFTDRWNAAAAGSDGLALDQLAPDAGGPDGERSGGGGDDPTFSASPTGSLAVRVRADGDSGELVEVVVLGDPSRDDPAFIVAAMDVLVSATDPTLSAAERRALLAEIGVAGGGGNSRRAVRGATEYVYGVNAVGAAGLSAAPG